MSKMPINIFTQYDKQKLREPQENKIHIEAEWNMCSIKAGLKQMDGRNNLEIAQIRYIRASVVVMII